jgi:hypothetical protein
MSDDNNLYCVLELSTIIIEFIYNKKFGNLCIWITKSCKNKTMDDILDDNLIDISPTFECLSYENFHIDDFVSIQKLIEPNVEHIKLIANKFGDYINKDNILLFLDQYYRRYVRTSTIIGIKNNICNKMQNLQM